MNRRRLLKRFAPVLVVAAAILMGWILVLTRPTPQMGRPMPSSPIVLAEPVRAGQAEVTVRVLGTVKPVQEVQLRPRVTGTVIAMDRDLQPGGYVHENQLLLQLDPTDYELEVRRKQSAVDMARADLELEMGQQKVARAELEQLQRNLPGLQQLPPGFANTALARREPHLAQSQAALASAEADLDTARVNLERTRIVAPFNALVTERSVSLGSQAGTTDVLATLVNTDEYWVEATVPLDRLEAIRSAAWSPLTAVIRLSSGETRVGMVQRLTGTLDTTSRMGQVLISVTDPLGLMSDNAHLSPLVLGDQVQVEIRLGAQDGVVALPRAALRGSGLVWVADNGSLDIRPVDILWRDTDTVYVRSGLRDGERVVTSDLAAPIQGMSIRVAGQEHEPPDTAEKRGGPKPEVSAESESGEPS